MKKSEVLSEVKNELEKILVVLNESTLTTAMCHLCTEYHISLNACEKCPLYVHLGEKCFITEEYKSFRKAKTDLSIFAYEWKTLIDNLIFDWRNIEANE